MNQLVSLAESAELKTEFEMMNAKIDGLLASGNQFLVKLDKGAADEEHYKAKELYKKGVVRFYKLRCSIAHAGTSSVIYEQFSDANDAVLQLPPAMEAIALKSLKVTAH